MTQILWLVQPDDPRAPPEEIWTQLTEVERIELVESLPSEISRTSPPEGDTHRAAALGPLGALSEFFKRIGRRVYLSSDLPVYYPNERVFAPDLFAVLDVDPHPRDRWAVSHEGKGLDFALEVMWRGDDRKDLERNVERYARLRIQEYFVYDRRRGALRGWSLAEADECRYEAIVPQLGRWTSKVLGLELGLESERVRFHVGTAPIPELAELALRAETLLASAEARAESEAERAQAEAERAQAEAERAQAEADRAQAEADRAQAEADRANQAEQANATLKRRIAELEAELAKLR